MVLPQVATFLMDLKNTPDGPGTSLLDNTLVLFSHVCIGTSIRSSTAGHFLRWKGVAFKPSLLDMKGR